MEIQAEREGRTLTAKATGRVDGVNASEFEQTLRDAIEEEDAAVILDLAGITYLSSAGLRAILLTARSLSQRKAKFLLCSPSAPIREVFEISGFDKIIPVHDSHAEAVAAIG